MVFLTIEKGLGIPELQYLAKSNLVSYPILLQIFDDMLLYIKDEVIFELTMWINLKVPKRTGQLRDTLIDTLNTSTAGTGELKIELGSFVEYASDVDIMRTFKVRHFNEWGTAYYYGHSGRILLNDPFAVGEFWERLQVHAHERLSFITQRASDEYFGGQGYIKGMKGKIYWEMIV